MENEIKTPSVQHLGSEHEQLLEERSDERPPINEIGENEASQETPGKDTLENETPEKACPDSSNLALRLVMKDIPELELCKNRSLKMEITQLAEPFPEPVETVVPQLPSPSPAPIEIDIPQQSDSSPELPDHDHQEHSGSDADNECSDEESPRALGEWQLRQLAENALEIALEVSTPKSSSPSPSNSDFCKPRTPLPERVWSPSSSDPARPNKPKCPPCERKKKRFDCLGSPPCNECRKRNMTAEQCASFAPVRRRGKRRMQDDDEMVTQKGEKRGKRR
jgi:hypothetical protein